VRQYRDHGYYAPVPVLTRAEAGVLRHCLEAFEATGGGMQGAVRHKPHLIAVSSPLPAIHRNPLKVLGI
jgi:non-heme Fe2+,alpha-ketoglutarate-dependent halogenase